MLAVVAESASFQAPAGNQPWYSNTERSPPQNGDAGANPKRDAASGYPTNEWAGHFSSASGYFQVMTTLT